MPIRAAGAPAAMARRLGLFWDRRPLRTKGMAVIALPMLVLFAALSAVVHTVRQEEAAEDEVKRTLNVQAQLQALEATVYRAALNIGNQGGGTLPAVEPEQAELDVPRLLGHLDVLVTDSVQQQRLDRLRILVLELLPLLRQPAPPLSGPTIATDRMPLVRLEPFTVAIEAMRERESVLLAVRTRTADEARQGNLLIIGIAIAAGLGGSVVAVLLLSRGIVRRIARVLEMAHQLAPGGELLDPSGSGDEVSRLAQALDRTGVLLAQRQQRLEELVARLFQVQEEERRRIAYQLHDGLAQVAAAAHQHLQTFAARHPPQHPDARAALDRAVDLVRRAVRETRITMAELRPTALDDLGLAAALQMEAEALRREGRRVEFHEELDGERPAPVIETALYRIAQEALVNIRKHAGPGAGVEVTLERREGALRLSIYDDGPGFDAERPARSGRSPGEQLGLAIMRERAALIGGTAVVVSAPGAGTCVRIDVPDPRFGSPDA